MVEEGSGETGACSYSLYVLVSKAVVYDMVVWGRGVGEGCGGEG